MTWCRVIERWVQRKTDQKLIFNGNYTQIVFFVFRIHFHYVLSYLFDLFGVRTCVYFDTHHCQKMQLLLEKIAKNHDFGDFWWFSCFWHDVTNDVTVTYTKYVCTFFGTNGLRRVIAIHSYHTLDVFNRFPRSWGEQNLPPRLLVGSNKPGSFRVNGFDYQKYILFIFFILKGHWTSNNIIPQHFPYFVPLEVLAWVMTVCQVLHSRLTHFWRNMKISSIFSFSKLTSINTQYSSLWDTLKMMLFTKYLIKWKCIGRNSWKLWYWFNLKSSIEFHIESSTEFDLKSSIEFHIKRYDRCPVYL